MSHFTVLVIGPDPESQLAPFHQFECTGVDDEYVQDIDLTEEMRNNFKSESCRMYKNQTGELFNPYQDEFYRDPTSEELEKIGIPIGTGWGHGMHWETKDWSDGRGFRTKIHYIPDGYTEVSLNMSESKSFYEYVRDYYSYNTLVEGDTPNLDDKHKYGYIVVNSRGDVVRVIERTNPNKQWDWYLLGGRWTGFFTMKHEYDGITGSPGVITPPAKYGTADQAIKGQIDFETIRRKDGEVARERYRKLAGFFGGSIPKVDIPWETLCDDSYDARREKYDQQPAMVRLNVIRKDKSLSNEDSLFLTFVNLESYQISEEEYVQNARDSATVTFAVIKDGKWYDRGNMGMWGIVTGEKDKDTWNQEFNALLDSLPDDTLLSIYDCHI